MISCFQIYGYFFSNKTLVITKNKNTKILNNKNINEYVDDGDFSVLILKRYKVSIYQLANITSDSVL